MSSQGKPTDSDGWALVDHFAVAEDDGARDLARQVSIMRHHQDRLTGIHEVREEMKDRIGGL